MAADRSRYGGTAEELADVLREFSTSPSWFQYHDKDGPGALKPQNFIKHNTLFQALAKKQKNLSFSQSIMQAALFSIAQDKQEEWALSWAEVLQQPGVIARRIRIACRHIAQASAKDKPPGWLADVMQDSAEAASVSGEFSFFGWDATLNVAWKSTAEGYGRKACRQTTKNIFPPPDKQPYKCMLAKFDGDEKEYELTDLTVEAWELMKQTQEQAEHQKKKTQGSPPLYERLHAPSGLMVTIRHRPDRQSLISIFHGGSHQCCQAPLAAFQSHEEALIFMKAMLQRMFQIG